MKEAQRDCSDEVYHRGWVMLNPLRV